MPDQPTVPDNAAKAADQLTMRRIELSAGPIGRLINTISLISGLIAVAVIVSVVAIALLGLPIPAELSNWGGIILGFYFGQFVTLLKDYMGSFSSLKPSPVHKESHIGQLRTSFPRASRSEPVLPCNAGRYQRGTLQVPGQPK